jgi:hypothetical protein
MSESEYSKYLSNINKFLKRIKNDPQFEFSVTYFTNTIVNQIKNDFLNGI